jgi:hypothetical protein
MTPRLLLLLGVVATTNLFARQAEPLSIPNPSHPRQAAESRAQRLRDENGTVASDVLLNALQQAQQMQYDAGVWSQTAAPKSGPRPLVAGLSTNSWQWLGPGKIGGRLRSILVHPTLPGTMWVGSVCGGVWKTLNGGASWFPCNDWMANLAIACMVMDPTDPNTLYAGTGEGFHNIDGLRGAGIFKSSDGGTNWAQLSSTTGSSFYYVNRLAVCPTNHLILLAAMGSGIWRSVNGGTNWLQAYAAPDFFQVHFHPTDGNKAVASKGNSYSSASLAIYSTDAGATWTPATGLATNNARIELAYAPSSPAIVYASQDTNQGSLYVSTNGGATYFLRNTGSNYLVSQGWYGNCIWVDPTSPSNLVVGGIDLWRSTNGGASLTKISDWAINQANNATVSVHADHHAIVNHPAFDGTANNTVFFANDGGVYATTNIYTAAIASGWTNLNHNLGITEFYGAAANAASQTVIGGTQDNGTPRYLPAGGTNGWSSMFGGDGGFCGADPSDPNFFYGEYVNLQIFRSTDGGQSASYIFNGLGDAGVAAGYDDDDPNAPTSANFIAPFVLDPNNPNTLLAGGSNLWRSVNAKSATPTWTIIKNGSPSGQFISAIAVARGNSDIIWVGHNKGEVYSTANGTAANPNWTQRNLGTPHLPSRFCSRLAIDPTNPNIIYATFGGFSIDNVYRSSDGGATWTNVASGLPSAPVNSIVISLFNHNFIYVGTQVGVFGSTNAGGSWSPANEGPANVNVNELTWMGSSLLAATGGRGVYSIALGPPSVTITPNLLSVPFGSNATFTATVVGVGPLSYQWQFNLTNIAAATNLTLTLSNVQPANAGNYDVVATGSLGTTTSAVAALNVLVPTVVTNYLGNGSNGFGGVIGNGTLTLGDDGINIYGTLTTGAAIDNALVLYIQSRPGGFASTSGFQDSADQLRSAISGYTAAGNNGGPGQSVLTFATGFRPNYALALQPGNGVNFGGLWALTNGGLNSLQFITSVNLTPTGTDVQGTYTFSLALTNIGLRPEIATNFLLFGTFVSDSGYRSTEAIAGNDSGVQGWNPFTQTSFVKYALAARSGTEISLSYPYVAEHQPVGTFVGSFKATLTSDSGYSFSLVNGAGSAGNSSFTVDAGGGLYTATALDYATQNSYSIRVRATENSSLAWAEKAFMITVISSNENVWLPVPSPFSWAQVDALAVAGTNLYCGGVFSGPGAASSRVESWNGQTWSAFGTGPSNGIVQALALSSSNLYAGGNFTAAGAFTNVNGIASWNGSAWSPLSSGVDLYSYGVYALAASGTNLYAGGFFDSAGGVTNTRNIARWNGNSWSPLGTGTDGFVYALAISGSNVYAGGDFTTAGSVTNAHNIARWNGSTWSSLGSGMDSFVYALAVSGTNLYAGGFFTTAGGVTNVNGVARWNGSAWSPLGSGIGGNVYALAISGSNVFAGGDFSTAGGVAAYNFARWNGNAWSALGSGMNGRVTALALLGGDLYAGGWFTTASGKAASASIAMSMIAAPAAPVSPPIAQSGNFVALFGGTPGATYTIEYANTFPPNWQKLTNVTVSPDNGSGVGLFELCDPILDAGPRFYRTLYPPY